jgi:hypothetical protein
MSDKKSGRKTRTITFNTTIDVDMISVSETYRNLYKACINSEQKKYIELARFFSVIVDCILKSTEALTTTELFELAAQKNNLVDTKLSTSRTKLYNNLKHLTQLGIISQPFQSRCTVSFDIDFLSDLAETIGSTKTKELPKTQYNSMKSVMRPPVSSRNMTHEKTIVLSQDNQNIMAIMMSILPDTTTDFVSQKLMLSIQEPNTTNIVNKEVTCEVSTRTSMNGDRSIMLAEDIEVYVALITVSYFTHAKARENSTLCDEYVIRNEIHAHIDDVARILYPHVDKIHYEHRERVTRAMERIWNTSFDFIGITNLIDLRDISMYNLDLIDGEIPDAKRKTQRFTPLLRCDREELIQRKNGKTHVISSSVDYTISLHPHIFETIAKQEFFYLIPPSLLGKRKDRLFQLYMQLRYRKKLEEFQLKFDELFFPHSFDGTADEKKAAFDKSSKAWKLLLQNLTAKTRARIRSKREPLTKEQNYLRARCLSRNLYKLWLYGYECVFDFAQSEIKVSRNEEVFLEAVKAGKNRRTPTISNELSSSVLPSTAGEVLEYGESVTTKAQISRVAGAVHFVENGQAKEVWLTNELVGEIHPLMTDAQFKGLCVAIADKLKCDTSLVEIFLSEEVSETAAFGSQIIKRDDFCTAFITWSRMSGTDPTSIESQERFYRFINEEPEMANQILLYSKA